MNLKPTQGVRGLQSVTAAILAGGFGTRLRSAYDGPKVLAPVGGRPFLTYLLERLEAARIGDVVLCTGYRAEAVENAFGPTFGSLHLSYSREETPLGTGGCLRLALPLVRSESVLILNGDSFCDMDLGVFAQWHYGSGMRNSIVLAQVPSTARFGRVRVAEDGRVLSFEEKGAEQGPGWINAGVYLLSREALASIPAGRPVSLEREMFPSWSETGLGGFCCHGRFLDIGTPESFAAAETFFAECASQ